MRRAFDAFWRCAATTFALLRAGWVCGAGGSVRMGCVEGCRWSLQAAAGCCWPLLFAAHHTQTIANTPTPPPCTNNTQTTNTHANTHTNIQKQSRRSSARASSARRASSSTKKPARGSR